MGSGEVTGAATDLYSVTEDTFSRFMHKQNPASSRVLHSPNITLMLSPAQCIAAVILPFSLVELLAFMELQGDSVTRALSL